MAFLPNNMLEQAFLTGVSNARPSEEAVRQSYAGLDLCPFEDVDSRQVLWDVVYSENQLAGFYGPDGNAIPGDDMLFTTEMTNLIDIKAARALKPRDVLLLREPGTLATYAESNAPSQRGQLTRLENTITKYTNWCNDRVDSHVEYVIMKAVSEGAVVWPPVDNDGNAISNPPAHWNAALTLNIPFNLPAVQNQDVTTLTGYDGATGGGYVWTNHTNADPIRDIKVYKAYMLKVWGVNLQGGEILMSQLDLDEMVQCANVLKWIVGTNYDQTKPEYLDLEALNKIVMTKTGMTIKLYDASWTFRTRPSTSKREIVQRVDFLKSGKIILKPSGPLGKMLSAPQIYIDPMTHNIEFVQRKMGWSDWLTRPPYGIDMGVDLVAWPQFEHYDWCVLDIYS